MTDFGSMLNCIKFFGQIVVQHQFGKQLKKHASLQCTENKHMHESCCWRVFVKLHTIKMLPHIRYLYHLSCHAMHSHNMAAAMLHENCGVIALISEHQTTLSLTRYKSADAMTQQFTCSIATIMLWLCIEWLLRW